MGMHNCIRLKWGKSNHDEAPNLTLNRLQWTLMIEKRVAPSQNCEWDIHTPLTSS